MTATSARCWLSLAAWTLDFTCACALAHAARSHLAVLLNNARPGESGALVRSVDADGPCIGAADRDLVLEPLSRLDSGRDRQTGGFGLGLAIVRSVALAHGVDVRL
ncbi:ATP-binding protein, partial [Burkholderia pseudomallei]|uniref:ATP-binding protein n=1 Tax=Burkholderia pseudomallei TaxID=28450 RepID=UPI002156205F